MARRTRSRELVLQGRGAAPGLTCGALRRPGAEPAQLAGSILVLPRASAEELERILSAAGTVCLGGALLSHAALLCRERGRPLTVFDAGTRLSLVDGGDGEPLLRLGDLVGTGRRAPVLDEGDVAILDGGVGSFRVPGGLDREARARVRETWRAILSAAAEDADALRAVAAAAAGDADLVIPLVVEAGIETRVLGLGPSATELLARIRRGPAGPALEQALRRAAGRAIERGRAAAGRARGAIVDIEDPDELGARLEREESELQRERAILLAAAVDPSPIDAALEDLAAAGQRRRHALGVELLDEVDRALRLGDEGIRARLGSLSLLAGRASAVADDDPRIERLARRVARLRRVARAELGDRFVLPLLDASASRSIVGGKAAGVQSAAVALPDRCAVPDGFVVTAAAYRLHLLGTAGDRLREAIESPIDEAACSRRARAAILGARLPDEVLAAVSGEVARLGQGPFAVRSSATIEDQDRSSLAGVFDTDLGVRGIDGVIDRLRWAWASLWSPRALALLGGTLRRWPSPDQAVIVQRMIETRVAGVMLSRDPHGAPDVALVNAWWGLGEGIAQGEFGGDLYWVRRGDGTVVATEAGGAEAKVVLDPDRRGTLRRPLDESERGRPCLTGDELALLAELARGLERVRGPGLDIEFGFAGDGTLHLFQCRRVAPSRGEPTSRPV